MPNLKKNILYLYVLHILNDGYSASILLFLPFIAKDLALNLTQAGLLGSMMQTAGLILAIPAGLIATRFGGIRVLTFALFLYGVGYLSIGLSPSFIVILLAFIFVGIGFGLFHPIAFALIPRWTDRSVLGREMSNFTAIGDVGRISIASVITFIIAAIGWRHTAFYSATLPLIIFIFLYFRFHHNNENNQGDSHVNKQVSFRSILQNSKFMFAALSGAFDQFASASLFVFLPFLLLEKGINPAFLGSMAAAFLIGNLLGKSTLGRLGDKFSAINVFIIAEVLTAIFIVLLTIVQSLPLIIVVSIMLGVMTRGTVPVAQVMVTNAAEEHGNFEKAIGVYSFMVNILLVIAPIGFGFISDNFGIVNAFYMSAIVCLSAIIPAYIYKVVK